MLAHVAIAKALLYFGLHLMKVITETVRVQALVYPLDRLIESKMVIKGDIVSFKLLESLILLRLGQREGFLGAFISVELTVP